MGRILVFGVFSLLLAAWTGIGAVSGARADPCPHPTQSNGPLTQQNQNTLNTAAQAAQDLPEDPALTQARSQTMKRERIRITLTGELDSGMPKTVFVDLTQNQVSILTNPKDPGYAQAVSDLSSAAAVFETATDQVACAPVRSAGAGRLIVPQPSSCGPQNFQQYLSYLKSQAGNLSPNAKALFGSMLLGNRLADLYRSNPGITPLPTVFQALVDNAKNAGECRDIQTFIAVSMQALGMKNAGVTGADWDNGTITGAHVVAQYQDPKTGQYIFINYGDAFETNDKYLSEAAQKAALDLNPYSTVTQVQSVDANGNGDLHEMQNARTQRIQHLINRYSDPNAPNVQIDAGNEDIAAGAQMKVLGGPNNNLAVFGAGEDMREGDAYQMAAGGARLDLGTHIATGKDTGVDLRGKTVDGVLYVRDQTPAGDVNATGARSETAYFTNTEGQADFSWKGSGNDAGRKGNSGMVGVKGDIQDAVYAKGGTSAGNLPYDTLTFFAVDNPGKSVQLHFSNTGFIANITEQNIGIGYHQVDQAAGVKLTHPFDRGRIVVANDVTAYNFKQRAYGVTDKLQLTWHSSKWGDFHLTGEMGAIHNRSRDAFYDYPLTCKIKADWEKRKGRLYFETGAEYNCNRHNPYTLFDGSSPDGNITPAQERYGFRIRW